MGPLGRGPSHVVTVCNQNFACQGGGGGLLTMTFFVVLIYVIIPLVLLQLLLRGVKK